MITIVYLYVTKFLLQMLYFSVTYRKTWLVPTSNELASVLFYCFLGFNFRPRSDNPYFVVTADTMIALEEPSASIDTRSLHVPSPDMTTEP